MLLKDFVKQRLHDTWYNLTDKLSFLQVGEGLLICEAGKMTSIVKLDKCSLPPYSNYIPYGNYGKKNGKKQILMK